MSDAFRYPSGSVVRATTAPDDALLTAARFLFFGGALTLSALRWRVGGLTASDIMLLLASVFLALSPKGNHRTALPAGLKLSAYLFCLGGLTAAFRADLPLTSLGSSLRLVFIVTLLMWTGRAVLDTEARVMTAVRLWLLGCTVFSIVTLYQAATGRVSAEVGYGRYVGLAQHPTDAGGILAIALPTALYLFMRGGHGRLAFFQLPLIALALLATGSVSGLLAATAGVALLLVRMRIGVRTLAIIALTVGLVVVVGPSVSSSFNISVTKRFNSTTGGGRYDTFAIRRQIDAYAAREALRQPFVGRGLDSSSVATPYAGDNPHNMLLLAWWGGGLATLVGLLVAFNAARRSAQALLIKSRLAVPLYSSAVVALAFAMTSPLLYNRYFWFPILVIFALASATRTAIPESAVTRRTYSERSYIT